MNQSSVETAGAGRNRGEPRANPARQVRNGDVVALRLFKRPGGAASLQGPARSFEYVLDCGGLVASQLQHRLAARSRGAGLSRLPISESRPSIAR
jgi:hypothetical protein